MLVKKVLVKISLQERFNHENNPVYCRGTIMSKRATLLIIAVLALSTLLVIDVASTIAAVPKPSIPEFTLKFEAHPYDVPPIYEVDQYTGENVMTQEGYHVENRSLVVTIENQPFTPFTDADGHAVSLFYNFSVKGRYGEDWKYCGCYLASDSDYTVVSFGLADSFREGYVCLGSFLGDIPADGEVDIRVQARIGTYIESREPWYFMDVYDVKFTGETSEWSETQTVKLSANQSPTPSPTTTPTPDLTPTPTPNEEIQTNTLTPIIGVTIVAVVIGAGLGLLLYLVKRK
jgi:hypothetical protein